jgi:hypothetical protein
MACDPPDARDWLFVEHGALLIDARGPLGGRYDALDAGAEWVGAILREARWLLPELAPGARRVIAIDEAHRPLAEAVARACEAELLGPGKGRIPAAIVPLLRGEDMKRLSHEDLDAEDALLFALTVDFTRTLPRVPDVIGAFARTATLTGELDIGPGEPAASLSAFVEPRRAHLRPRVIPARTAYVPDEPLPR